MSKPSLIREIDGYVYNFHEAFHSKKSAREEWLKLHKLGAQARVIELNTPINDNLYFAVFIKGIPIDSVSFLSKSYLHKSPSLIHKVIDLMRRENIPTDEASPNFVSSFAYDRGINLSSEEIVKISDKYVR